MKKRIHLPSGATKSDREYLLGITTAIESKLHYTVRMVELRYNHTVTVEVENDTFTFKDIMALRKIFGAEFNFSSEIVDGYALSEVTFEAGYSYMIFTFTRPKSSLLKEG